MRGYLKTGGDIFCHDSSKSEADHSLHQDAPGQSIPRTESDTVCRPPAIDGEVSVPSRGEVTPGSKTVQVVSGTDGEPEVGAEHRRQEAFVNRSLSPAGGKICAAPSTLPVRFAQGATPKNHGCALAHLVVR